MEGLINILQKLQNSIQKGFINFKKSPKERLTIEYIETRKELLEQNWSNFESIHCKLYENYSAEQIGQKVDSIYESTEDSYINYKTHMKTLLNSISGKISGQDINTDKSNKKSSAFVKLPKISIPSFSGQYSEWATFNDLFKALVHNNEALSDCQKLHYLKDHLTGEAEQLIRYTPISDANYRQCWELLEKRYNNKRHLADCILKRLFGQKRLHTESGKGLKELFDTTNDCLKALKHLNVDVTTWDVIIIHIVSYKLDFETRKQWELSIGNLSGNELPSMKQFETFLETRYRALEFVEPNRSSVHQGKVSTGLNHKALLATNSSAKRCEYCQEASHKLCFCKKFAKQPVDVRRDFVAKQNICFNCLGSNHSVYGCKNPATCRVCKKRHHSLLHPVSKGDALVDSSDTTANGEPLVSCLSTGAVLKPRSVLLATALINAESKMGHPQIVRALLDQGSQACFITEATVQLLGLKRIPIQGIINGLGSGKSTVAKHIVHVTIQSRVDSSFQLHLSAYVLNKITTYLPEKDLDTCNFDWIKTKDLYLADPQFSTPNRIDILLGADVYSCIIQEGIVKSPHGTLIAQSTALGWILSGTVNAVNKPKTKNISVMHAQINEDDSLKKFWEVEEKFSRNKLLTPEEQQCEDLYRRTTKQDDDGRYVVRLPFRDVNPLCKAGNSRGIAESRFKSLEKRLGKNEKLKEEYTKVIKEYLLLGHMRAVKKNDKKRQEAVYLPHHAVIREDKTTTKVRVVFNASEKNNKGISLNDSLMVGPTLQADLRHTILKWRRHAIGLVADIIKMYRQVRVAEEDVMFQRILWRDSPDMPLEDYELLTVTFGTASAPYQAVRTLHQIAYDEGNKYPLAYNRVLNAFYMDDLMTGCDSVEEGTEIVKQITALLKTGGFELQKWNSNCKNMLEVIQAIEKDKVIEQLDKTSKYKKDNMKENREEEVEEQNKLKIKLDNTVKILGLTWNRSEDMFQYSVNLPSVLIPPGTKRAIISEISRLFDPLGWLAPCVVLAKIFIQKLWLAGVGWDEELSTDLVQEWRTYRTELSLITRVQVPRWLGTKPTDELELHGFSDASKVAYSAVIYLRGIDATGQVHVSLLVAKTRVAPIKQLSIPRLELCGAVLMAQLLMETAEILNIPQERIAAWTDSTVVLAWLNSHPSRWQTFVANRTSEVLSITKPNQWFHISTKDNPADCASRGLLPSQLMEHEIWFSGPSFLKHKIINYERPKDLKINLEESVKAHVAVVPDNSIIERFSSLSRLVRVVAYCRRFLNKGKNEEIYLQRRELEDALNSCIKKVQSEGFNEEYLQLQKNKPLSSKSKLKSLCPYLDNQGILRAKGRLQNSDLEQLTKHPIVLPSDNHLTELIVADAHHKTLHGGPQQMLCYLRTAYWILGAKNLVKNHFRRCVRCTRYMHRAQHQLMGALPTVRCTPARPFLHSGVDYAGPVQIRTTKGRGHHAYKGYICLFVCMCTRALHLEVVSDMTTQAFLAAFRRFVSRRGHCAKLWSDNGTTFVGASKELQQLKCIQAEIAEHLESNGTEWHFIPPHGPNFGGLWEAGVKSTKYHLKRVIGESTLTYEELSTLLTQVEACLNSRPINIISATDPGELMPLTPGHFLIGEPIVNVPDYNYENSNVNCLTRWQFVQRMLQSFWRRWSSEYLSNLMQRYKWSKQEPEPKVGDIVLIKEDDLPPSRWLLGRIEQKHPGDDKITRVVTLRTGSSVLKRPTSRLCILPVLDQ